MSYRTNRRLDADSLPDGLGVELKRMPQSNDHPSNPVATIPVSEIAPIEAEDVIEYELLTAVDDLASASPEAINEQTDRVLTVESQSTIQVAITASIGSYDSSATFHALIQGGFDSVPIHVDVVWVETDFGTSTVTP
jgi:hypothetical protein